MFLHDIVFIFLQLLQNYRILTTTPEDKTWVLMNTKTCSKL